MECSSSTDTRMKGKDIFVNTPFGFWGFGGISGFMRAFFAKISNRKIEIESRKTILFFGESRKKVLWV